MGLLIILVCVLLSILANNLINNTYNKYMQIDAECGLTGAQAAEKFLRDNGVYDVSIDIVDGRLTDNYDPTRKIISLSRDIFFGRSVASVAIACHEAGHALQHAENYSMLSLRNKMIPTVQKANAACWTLMIIGLLFSWQYIALLGLICFVLIALFQFVTLPVEFNASNRALAYLDGNLLDENNHDGARKVLKAAAFTYVVSLLVSLLTMFRFATIIAGNNRRH